MLFEPYCRRHDCIVAARGLSESRRPLLCADSRGGRKRHHLFSIFLPRRNPFHGLAEGKFIRGPSSLKSTDMLSLPDVLLHCRNLVRAPRLLTWSRPG